MPQTGSANNHQNTLDDKIHLQVHNAYMNNLIKQRHPRVLPFLFLTEMWERFGFYIVQGLLVLYMTQYFGLPDSESYTILGIYTALAYTAPLIGGVIASKILGYETSIIWGGFFLIIGYGLLALPYTETLLYPALATIIVGTGFFKPNISSLLGTQYEFHDPRRDSGFTIFYIGINVGILMAGLSSGYIKEYFGWRVSFGLASIGLVAGLITFLYGTRFLIKTPQPIDVQPKHQYRLLACCFLAILGLNFLLRLSVLADWLLPCVGIVLLIYISILTLRQDAVYKKRMLVLNILTVSSVVFWMLYLQQFYSAMLYIDRLIDKTVFGVKLSPTVFYASQGAFIILLGPFFAWLWDLLSLHGKNPSPINKFILGILGAGLSCLVLGVSTYFPNSEGMISPFWIFLAYILLTIGELLLSPVGLSAVTLLSPPNLTGMMMGVWFVALGFGGIFAGWIAKISSIPDSMQDNAQKLLIYQHAFFDYAYIALGVAVVLFVLRLTFKQLK